MISTVQNGRFIYCYSTPTISSFTYVRIYIPDIKVHCNGVAEVRFIAGDSAKATRANVNPSDGATVCKEQVGNLYMRWQH